ncbi:MAG TPA: type III-B CRISPR-associated protein Cas10/Cmr2 [Gemmataceae bacterium]|nr:type III-B CRISPR-associated protein Cas10/Cmr2 [Gemmataceae bacterium]
MTAHLLALTVGPVQEFIAAARRTRDLWFGSHLLSEISKAVARSVRDDGGELIFPHPDSDLTPGPDTNIANVIVAVIPADKSKPVEIAGTAKQSAKACWRTFAAGVMKDDVIAAVIRPAIWTEQVDDVVEFYAAWVPLGDDYRAARAGVMRLLAGRKNCRDFVQAERHPGLPKSSLDGMRDTVLLGPRAGEDPRTYRDSWPGEARRRLRVRNGEQLDVIGVVKRVAGGDKPYPSVARVAADPWIRGREGRLGVVIAECKRLGPAVIRGLNVYENGHPHYAAFPYEGTAVFRSRHYELEQEAGLDEGSLRPLTKAVAGLGEPNPYLAAILADGDNMGKTISELACADQHREFSATLARFAAEAKRIVEKNNHGVLVYSGGDDVLAFVPVDQCLDCARELHDTFGDLLKAPAEKAGTTITLSVGVAIGHFMENLEDLREYARAAEKHAKKPDVNGVKDALAVHLHKRGGSPIKVRAKWTDRLDARLKQFAEWLRDDTIPNRLAADLNRMADVYDGWRRDDETAKQRVKEAIERDVLRVIAAKQRHGGGSLRERLRPVLDCVTDAAALRQLAEELLIARQIAAALQVATHTNESDQ